MASVTVCITRCFVEHGIVEDMSRWHGVPAASTWNQPSPTSWTSGQYGVYATHSPTVPVPIATRAVKRIPIDIAPVFAIHRLHIQCRLTGIRSHLWRHRHLNCLWNPVPAKSSMGASSLTESWSLTKTLRLSYGMAAKFKWAAVSRLRGPCLTTNSQEFKGMWFKPALAILQLSAVIRSSIDHQNEHQPLYEFSFSSSAIPVFASNDTNPL